MSKFEKALDNSNLELTESQRDAFDFSAKRNLIDLDTYNNDTFNLLGYKLNKVLDDILLVQYVDLANDGKSVVRGGIHIPLSQVQRTWRLARVILSGPLCKYAEPGDIVCFPDDKGIKVDNISVSGIDSSVRDCVFLNEQRIFGVCEIDESEQIKSTE
tara:strand:+ start:1216 stop:1689 length:474 start_codon:yes stop_codon:yes gene_type:complete